MLADSLLLRAGPAASAALSDLHTPDVWSSISPMLMWTLAKCFWHFTNAAERREGCCLNCFLSFHKKGLSRAVKNLFLCRTQTPFAFSCHLPVLLPTFLSLFPDMLCGPPLLMLSVDIIFLSVGESGKQGVRVWWDFLVSLQRCFSFIGPNSVRWHFTGETYWLPSGAPFYLISLSHEHAWNNH